jgi:integrase
MPPRRNPVPSYLLHKASGRAYCNIRRADGTREQVYLGVYDSPESRAEYARVIAGHTPPVPPDTANPVVAQPGPLAVGELVVRFLEHARGYYRRADGTQTREVGEFTMALRPVRHLFGDLAATDFGPRALRAVRELMVSGYTHPDYGTQPALSRGVVNQRVGRVVRAFRWAASEELVPVAVYQGLATVPGLKAGRSAATETEPVQPVEWAIVEKTVAHLNAVVKAMVLFAWHTGARPGEVCGIRADEIDRSGPVWYYRPSGHKMAYRGKARVVAIGKQAQAILAPFLGRPGYLFSPRDAVDLRNAAKRAARKTRVQPSQQYRRKPNPKRKPGTRYQPAQMGTAIKRAAKAAGVAPWHPNQLRHAFATRVRAAFGLEAAQVVLGHSNANITQTYAERDQSLAGRVAGTIG